MLQAQNELPFGSKLVRLVGSSIQLFQKLTHPAMACYRIWNATEKRYHQTINYPRNTPGSIISQSHFRIHLNSSTKNPALLADC